MIKNQNVSKKNIRYRPEIDGLRGFAIIAVLINHFNKDILPSGYLGVDIFFVISGYVITSSLINKRIDGFNVFFLTILWYGCNNIFFIPGGLLIRGRGYGGYGGPPLGHVVDEAFSCRIL